MAKPTITYAGRTYRQFIPYPQPVRDGTLRCIFCGQIDEEWGHEITLCCGSEKFDEAAYRALHSRPLKEADHG